MRRLGGLDVPAVPFSQQDPVRRVLVAQHALRRSATDGVEQRRFLPLSDVADNLCEQEAAARLHDEGYAAAPAHHGVGGQSHDRERGRQQDQ